LPVALVVGKEKRMIFEDRPADSSTKLLRWKGALLEAAIRTAMMPVKH
jgi:hypothetical protein